MLQLLHPSPIVQCYWYLLAMGIYWGDTGSLHSWLLTELHHGSFFSTCWASICPISATEIVDQVVFFLIVWRQWWVQPFNPSLTFLVIYVCWAISISGINVYPYLFSRQFSLHLTSNVEVEHWWSILWQRVLSLVPGCIDKTTMSQYKQHSPAWSYVG